MEQFDHLRRGLLWGTSVFIDLTANVPLFSSQAYRIFWVEEKKKKENKGIKCRIKKKNEIKIQIVLATLAEKHAFSSIKSPN